MATQNTIKSLDPAMEVFEFGQEQQVWNIGPRAITNLGRLQEDLQSIRAHDHSIDG